VNSPDPLDPMAAWSAAVQRLWAGVPGAPPVPPATFSASRLQAVLDDLAARRGQVQALRDQLSAFDEQLAGLEAALAPLLEWTRVWSGVERAVTEVWKPPPSR
jgi:hypothetical protein